MKEFTMPDWTHGKQHEYRLKPIAPIPGCRKTRANQIEMLQLSTGILRAKQNFEGGV